MENNRYIEQMETFLKRMENSVYFDEKQQEEIEKYTQKISEGIKSNNIEEIQKLENEMEEYIMQIEPALYPEFVNPSEKVTLKALSNYGSMITLIDNPTEEMYITASKTGGGKDIPVEKFTEEMGLNMVYNDASDIQYAPIQTEAMNLHAVSVDGTLLKYIQDQSEDVIKQAILQNKESARFAKYQTEEVKNMLIEMNAYELIDNPSFANDINAVDKDWKNLDKMYLQNDAVQRYAVQKNPNALEYVILPEKETIKLGLEKNPEVERFVRHKDTLEEVKAEMEAERLRIATEEHDKSEQNREEEIYQPKSFDEAKKEFKNKSDALLEQTAQDISRDAKNKEKDLDEMERTL